MKILSLLATVAVGVCMVSGAQAQNSPASTEFKSDDNGYKQRVLDRLQRRQPFDGKSIPERDFGTAWAQVPKWQAGIWTATEQSNYDGDKLTYTEKGARVADFGSVEDKNGDIWQPVGTPSFGTIKADRKLVYQFGYPVSYVITRKGAVEEVINTVEIQTVKGVITEINEGPTKSVMSPLSPT